MVKASSVFFVLFVVCLTVTVICAIFSILGFTIFYTITFHPENLAELIILLALFIVFFELGIFGYFFWITLTIIFAVLTSIFFVLWLIFRRRDIEKRIFRF